MRTYALYCSKQNKHIRRKLNLAGSIHNHLIAPRRRYDRIFGKDAVNPLKVGASTL
ncbi:MAG: hypothetical protein LBD04_07875 [Synergistaceae bacterium]|nr:hypothetical protein [Synergistaceae bacterium]